MFDLAGEMATRDNLIRILNGIGSPRAPVLKIAIFYCNGNMNSPIDQDGLDFLSEDVLSRFSGWGIYCIGCDVGQTLGRRALAAGAHFVIAFNAAVAFVHGHEEEFVHALNSGIISLLRRRIAPSMAAAEIRETFLSIAQGAKLKFSSSDNSFELFHAAAFARTNAEAVEYFGPTLVAELCKIEPGRLGARRYQQVVAEMLSQIFYPDLDESSIEVHSDSGLSRYDIVFSNRAERGFWHDIKISRGNSLVIFDAKNKRVLRAADADQMLRYSGPWRGQVIFIVCRRKPSPMFTRRTSDLLKERDCCLIVLDDHDLRDLYQLKLQGSDPSVLVEKLYRERILCA